MNKFLRSEAGAVILWAFGSLMIAAVFAPWFYAWGKQLATACENGDLPAAIEWLGASCGRAKLGRFFNRAMMLGALILLPALIRRIRKISREQNAGKIIQLSPQGAPLALSQILIGCLIAGGILWATGLILGAVGAYTPDPDPVTTSKLINKVLLPAIGASFIEEWVFRGLLLGLWLRTAKPISACIGSSLLFSFLHFLKPLSGIDDPTHLLAGFELLGKTLLHFAEPLFFVTDFLTLTVVGLILCWTRLRTGALWFPIGLHAGWVLAFKAHGLFYDQADHHALSPWGIGDSLRSGAIPLAALAVTAAACHFALHALDRRSTSKTTTAA